MLFLFKSKTSNVFFAAVSKAFLVMLQSFEKSPIVSDRGDLFHLTIGKHIIS